MTVKTLKRVVWRGTCPGGNYLDNMQKSIPCPQKTIETEAKDSSKPPKMYCPRCHSEITPELITTDTIIGVFDVED